MYGCKGTITVFLSLLSVLFLSLFCTMLESVRVQGARLQAAAAFDMGLFSIFGEYDKVLLEEYDLWFLDGTYGEQSFSKERLEVKLCDYMYPNLHPAEGIPLAGVWNLFPIETDGCKAERVAFATDGGGQVFYQQVVENEKELAAGNVAGKLRKTMEEIEKQEKQGEDYQKEESAAKEEMRQAEAKQEEEMRQAEAKQEEEMRQAETKQEEKQDNSENAGDVITNQADQKKEDNPLESIKKIKKKGILGLVMPQGKEVSDKRLTVKSLPSTRKLRKGTFPIKKKTGIFFEAVFAEYLKQHFSCAADKEQDVKHALAYELEYIGAGKSSDIENLKAIVNRILLLREGVNYACIERDAAMRSETQALAAAIAGAAAIPALTAALQKALELAWAYGESLLDVRMLLSGGKVPLVKASADWKLSLERLGKLEEVLQECDKGGGEGQNYQDYLMGILALQKKEKRNLRVLDLIEAGRRMEKGGENFRADALVAELEAECFFSLKPVFLIIPAMWMGISNQGTAYRIKGQYGYMEGGV